MKSSSMAKFVGLAFIGALLLYFGLFHGIEHLRHRKGPWQVTFQTDDLLRPTMIIKQDALGIDSFWLSFDTNLNTALAPTNFVFDAPKPTPHSVPFGECLFMDTLFLPGTVAFRIHGHEIQLLPRTLLIDEREYRWEPRASLLVSGEQVLLEPVD